MHTKKIAGFGIAGLLAIAAFADAVRYLKPDSEYKQPIQSLQKSSSSNFNEMILVYNAYGGIYPGIEDVIHKAFFPKTYPCNLCFL